MTLTTAPETVLPWLRLRSVTGIGNLIFRRLIVRFGEPTAVFEAGSDALLAVEGITPRLVNRIRQSGRRTDPAGEQALDKCRQMGCQIVTQADRRYPALLLEIADPPPYLYVYGDTAAFPVSVAMVGSRHATSYGLTTTRRLSSDLARRGITVVSGLARGIDTAAHEGALQGGGFTVAVLGSGLARIYPRENTRLCQRIAAQGGAVVSEFPLDAGPDPHHFPQRNRIISGMTLGTVVVEATRRSGSLITARMALEQNREIFAIPGSVNSFKSIGTHALIKEGAKLVTQVDDILEELPPLARKGPVDRETSSVQPAPVTLSAEEQAVLKALSPYPIHVDELIRKVAIAPGRMAGILLTLELEGLVHQEPGKLFRLTEEMPSLSSKMESGR